MFFSPFILQVSAEEKKTLQDKLIASSYGLSGAKVEEYDVYKVSSFKHYKNYRVLKNE